MPYAILNDQRMIARVVQKLSPSLGTLSQPACRYNPPAFDPETQTCTPVQPVPEGATTVEFVVVDKPDAQLTRGARLIERLTAQLQERLDGFAQQRGYDGILSLCTYATSSVPKFATEGQRGVEMRDATWARCYEILAEVQGGQRAAPAGLADLENDLPPLVWNEP